MTSLDGEQELADVAKSLNPMDSMLMKHRTLTLFGEVNQDVSRRLAEKLLALAPDHLQLVGGDETKDLGLG